MKRHTIINAKRALVNRGWITKINRTGVYIPKLYRYSDNTVQDRQQSCRDEDEQKVGSGQRKVQNGQHSSLGEYLDKAGIPPKYLDRSFDNFEVTVYNRRSCTLCREYASEPAGNLFIYGDYGTGKTHIAAAVTRELLLQGKEVVFTSVPGLLFEIRKSFGRESTDTEAFYVERYTCCAFLVLDDLGIEKTTEWARQTLDYIIYERDNHLRSTVITSNLSLDEIAEKVDGRISSRLAGMGRVIQFKGADYRLRRAG